MRLLVFYLARLFVKLLVLLPPPLFGIAIRRIGNIIQVSFCLAVYYV